MKGRIMQHTKNNHSKAQLTDDIESAVYQFVGESSKKGLTFDDKWGSPFGKNNKFRFIGNPDRTFGTVYNWKEGTSQTFYIKGYKDKIKFSKPPAPVNKRDFKAEFSKLKQCKTHPYLKAKEVRALKFFKESDYRGIKNNPGKALCVPFKSCKTKEVAGWQYFWANGEKEFVKGKIEGPVYLFIAGSKEDNKIHVCEGLTTALSVNQITGRGVYCSFGKANMEAVTEMALNNHKKYTIAISGDRDKKNQYYPNEKILNNKRVVFLIPDSVGDWNDFKHNSFEKAHLKTLDINEARLLSSIKIENIKPDSPKAFYENFLLDFDFNFVFGLRKLGKSRALLWIINKAVEIFNKLNNTKKRCHIISKDNDEDTMLSPLLKELKAEKNFEAGNPKILKDFSKVSPQPKTMNDKIALVLKRIEIYIAINREDIACLLIDPLPNFFSWTDESLVSHLTDGLRALARSYKVCIIGVRNEVKQQSGQNQYDSSDRYKGSSAVADDSRQVNRAVAVHPRSALGKRDDCKGKKAIVLYTELSSHYGAQAFLFTLKIEKKTDDYSIAVPVFIEKIEGNQEKIKYLCDKRSGQTLSHKIISYLQKTATKSASLEDLYSEFGEHYTEKIIKNTVYKNFDYKKLNKTTFVFLNPPEK